MIVAKYRKQELVVNYTILTFLALIALLPILLLFFNSIKPQEEFGVKDRKSTRLNSSHVVISYAVFCLKKKTKHTDSSFRVMRALLSTLFF